MEVAEFGANVAADMDPPKIVFLVSVLAVVVVDAKTVLATELAFAAV